MFCNMGHKNFIQRRVEFVLPEHEEAFRVMEKAAMKAGGVLEPPRQSKKFRLMCVVFGWARAKRIKGLAWKLGLLVKRNVDRAFSGVIGPNRK